MYLKSYFSIKREKICQSAYTIFRMGNTYLTSRFITSAEIAVYIRCHTASSFWKYMTHYNMAPNSAIIAICIISI